MSHQLPPLPEPDGVCEVVVGHKTIRGMQGDIIESRDAWSEGKVRTYAELAIASVKREPLSEEKIEAIAKSHESGGCGVVGDKGLTSHFFDPDGLAVFIRAIEQAHGITKEKE